MNMKMTSQSQLLEMAKVLEGIPILHCLPNMPAAKLGIGYGDIILMVNDQRVSNIEQYANAKNIRQDGMSMLIWRGGQELSFEMEFPSDNGED